MVEITSETAGDAAAGEAVAAAVTIAISATIAKSTSTYSKMQNTTRFSKHSTVKFRIFRVVMQKVEHYRGGGGRHGNCLRGATRHHPSPWTCF